MHILIKLLINSSFLRVIQRKSIPQGGTSNNNLISLIFNFCHGHQFKLKVYMKLCWKFFSTSSTLSQIFSHYQVSEWMNVRVISLIHSNVDLFLNLSFQINRISTRWTKVSSLNFTFHRTNTMNGIYLAVNFGSRILTLFKVRLKFNNNAL